ncbi:hypothetical protein VB10N_20620 [Vibrio sp. 10N]|nr:hypothetical protein VB10N_20620 [Vibrio sp. 10N]
MVTAAKDSQKLRLAAENGTSVNTADDANRMTTKRWILACTNNKQLITANIINARTVDMAKYPKAQ